VECPHPPHNRECVANLGRQPAGLKALTEMAAEEFGDLGVIRTGVARVAHLQPVVLCGLTVVAIIIGKTGALMQVLKRTREYSFLKRRG